MLQQEVEPPCPRLDELLPKQFQLSAQAENRRIARDKLLDPPLGQLGMGLEPKPFRPDVGLLH